ncbi:MAG TPA: hypothetical protein VEA99_06940 [Gemmatimonadaceae bacterium]|nr:hypothetical protein [Gemmatimonadaceae bacterium]
MRELTMYCSARDQDVRVVLTDELANDGQAPVVDGEVLCLEIGDKCTGSMCPICAMSPEAVDARLVHHGLKPEVHRKIHGHCINCEVDSELIMSSGGYVTCSVCGAMTRWRVAQ